MAASLHLVRWSTCSRDALMPATIEEQRQAFMDLIPTIETVCTRGQDLTSLSVPMQRALALLDPDRPAAFQPLNLREILDQEPAPPRFLLEPFIPAARKILAVGPAESGKSIYAAWAAARLTRKSHRVVYISQENPRDEEIRRLQRLRPDPDKLELFHEQGIDLARPGDVRELVTVAENAALVVIDTLTACWSGREEDNAEVAEFDRRVLGPLVNQTGASVLLLDHVGHTQPFRKREGVSAPRGASAKAQKADVLLHFLPSKLEREFEIRVGKMRVGTARRPLPALLKVVDTDDGLLTIETVGEADSAADARIAEVADAAVAVIEQAPDGLSTNQLRAALKAVTDAGKDTQSKAMKLLEKERPRRVTCSKEKLASSRGQPAKVWRAVSVTTTTPQGRELIE